MNLSTKDIQMKYTLGKILLSLLFYSTLTFANNSLATYKISANKSTAVVKEPITISFEAHQKDHTDHIFFYLKPYKSDDYSIVLLNKEIDDSKYHDSSTTYTYLLFPLKQKKLHVEFEFIIKTASDKAIKQSYVDDHDDSVGISTYDTKVKLNAITIDVKALQHPVDLVGDFRFTSKVDRTQISQFENVNLHYTLVGKGYKAENIHFMKNKNQTITLFKNVHSDINKLTKDGYIIKKEYIYALSAKENFTIPALEIKAYSPTKHLYYTLQTVQKKIHVKKIDTKTLLDKVEYPKKEQLDLAYYKNTFIAIIIFFAGFLTAKLSENINYKRKAKPFEDIRNAKSAQVLSLLLLNKYKNKEIREFIDMLEMLEYKKTSLSLGSIKSQIIKSFM